MAVFKQTKGRLENQQRATRPHTSLAGPRIGVLNEVKMAKPGQTVLRGWPNERILPEACIVTAACSCFCETHMLVLICLLCSMRPLLCRICTDDATVLPYSAGSHPQDLQVMCPPFFLRNLPPHGEIAGRRSLIGPVSCRGGAKRRDR